MRPCQAAHTQNANDQQNSFHSEAPWLDFSSLSLTVRGGHCRVTSRSKERKMLTTAQNRNLSPFGHPRNDVILSASGGGRRSVATFCDAMVRFTVRRKHQMRMNLC